MALFPFESDGLLTIDVNEPVEYIPKLLIVSRSVSCEISTSVDFKKLSIPDVFNSPPTRKENLTSVNRFSLVGGLIANAEFTEKIRPFLGIGKFKAESFTPERSTMKITLNSVGTVIAFIIPQTSIKYRIEAAIIHTGSLTKLDVISDETEYGRFQKSEGGATASYSGYAYLVCYGINKFVDYNIE